MTVEAEAVEAEAVEAEAVEVEAVEAEAVEVEAEAVEAEAVEAEAVEAEAFNTIFILFTFFLAFETEILTRYSTRQKKTFHTAVFNHRRYCVVQTVV